jgi:hypothetical protein
VGRTTLRAFCLSALWQIYETLYLLLRVQEFRFITPSQGTGLTVLSMGDGIRTPLSFRLPDPIGTTAFSTTSTPVTAKSHSNISIKHQVYQSLISCSENSLPVSLP